MKRFIFLACFTSALVMLHTIQAHAAPTTEVIPLHYGMAEDVLPAVQPLLRENERVSTYGNQLIIRAEPERLQEIRALLTELDRRPTQLRISVANAATRVANQSGYSLDGRIKSDTGDIVFGQPRSGNKARIIRRDTAGVNDAVRVILASEGHPVLIQTGHSIPLTSSTHVYGQVMRQTEYHDVTSGFYASVRLHGDHATITLSANNNHLSPSGGNIVELQRADTVVTTRLGEWVSIGGVDDLDDQQDRRIGRRTTTRNASEQSIRLMVERVN